MTEKSVTLAPGEIVSVSFKATAHEARTYQVSVNGLKWSFTALPATYANSYGARSMASLIIIVSALALLGYAVWNFGNLSGWLKK